MKCARRVVAVSLASVVGMSGVVSCAWAQEVDHGRKHASESTAEAAAQPPDAADLSVAELEARARKRELAGGQAPLADYPRKVTGGRDCPDVDLVEYDGKVIDYNRPIEVTREFRDRLIRFERIVAGVATEVYGRPPIRVVHAGGHTCKTVGGKGDKLSEHAFGHAIDVAGFDFAADPTAAAQPPKGRRGAFSVRVADHWDVTEGLGAKHSLFLHRLTDVLERKGPFSTMLGPAYKGHDRLFHFDFGPEFFFRI